MTQNENISTTTEEARKQMPEKQSPLNSKPGLFDPEMELRVKKSANWFIWIAVFGLLGYILETINSEKEWFFSFAAPKWLNSQLTGSQTPVILLVLVLAIAFGLIGYFSGKGKSLPYLIGLLLYILDAIPAFLLQDLMMIVFHLIVAFGLILGFSHLRKFEKSKSERLNIR